MGPKIDNMLPKEMKNSKSTRLFKKGLQVWIGKKDRSTLHKLVKTPTVTDEVMHHHDR